MEASSPEPRPVTPPLPKRERGALGHDPTKPIMTAGDLLDSPLVGMLTPDLDDRDTLVIAREMRERATTGGPMSPAVRRPPRS